MRSRQSLPSPPDSPSLDPYDDGDADSLSSFPSVSSSVFFSSDAASPHSHPYSGFNSHPQSGQLRHAQLHDHEHDHIHDAGLIIPSLTLPSALPQPTPYGQTLGEVSLILVGPKGVDKTALAEFLVDLDDVLDSGTWQTIDGGRVLHASTEWIEERDLHGLERFEGTSNVAILELDGFDPAEKPESVVNSVLHYVYGVFQDIESQLDSSPSSPLLHSLLASSHSTLHTALLYVTASPLTPQDHAIVSALATTIPVVPFSVASSGLTFFFSHHPQIQSKLSSFQPRSHSALRLGLFRSPQTLALLRQEAADRFMRWREVERAVSGYDKSKQDTRATLTLIDDLTFGPTCGDRSYRDKMCSLNKAVWETYLSEDIARRIRQVFSSDGLVLEKNGVALPEHTVSSSHHSCFCPILDPLHLRSLVVLSWTALTNGAFKTKCSRYSTISAEELTNTQSTIKPSKDDTSLRWRAWRLGITIVSVFCAGIGIGLALSN